MRKLLGILLIVIGFVALITPFTPGSWLIFVGLGVLGVNIAFWDRIKEIFKEYFKPKTPT